MSQATPLCSPCGMVVDHLRECYESEWHLFGDSPGVTTRGRYYWAPEGAKEFPGWHHWSSRNWTNKNWTNVQGLGESLTYRHVHVSGEFDGTLPEQRPAGSLQCAAEGARFADRAGPGDLWNGYPAVCYVPPPPDVTPPIPLPVLPDVVGPLAGWDQSSAFFRCQVQHLWARVIGWLYDDNNAAIVAALRAFYGPGPAINIHAVEQNYPAVVTVVHPEWAVAVADGTRDFQTLAFQGFDSLGGPTNQGLYSTVPLWQRAARNINRHLEADGVNDTRPIFLCGHSYGAAASLILAAMFRHWAPTRSIRYLTFGCPKVGDDRLVALLRRLDGLNLANHNDLVTSIPPDRLTSAALVGVFPLVNFIDMGKWERPEGVMQQAADGSLAPGPPPFLDFGTLFGMVTRIVGSLPQPEILGHAISAYLERIELRCPQAGWPVSTEVEDMLDSDDAGPGPGLLVGGASGYPEDYSGGLLGGGQDEPPTLQGGLLGGGQDEPPTLQGGLLGGGDE